MKNDPILVYPYEVCNERIGQLWVWLSFWPDLPKMPPCDGLILTFSWRVLYCYCTCAYLWTQAFWSTPDCFHCCWKRRWDFFQHQIPQILTITSVFSAFLPLSQALTPFYVHKRKRYIVEKYHKFSFGFPSKKTSSSIKDASLSRRCRDFPVFGSKYKPNSIPIGLGSQYYSSFLFS